MPRNCAKDIIDEIEHMLPQELKKHKQIRQKFTKDEDLLIVNLVGDNQFPNWNEIAKSIPSKSGRQCRERFQNYLSPNLSKEPWTKEEDELIIKLYKQYGSSWSLIADHFGGKRTNNNIKNRWNTYLKSKFLGVTNDKNITVMSKYEGKNIHQDNISADVNPLNISSDIALNTQKCILNSAINHFTNNNVGGCHQKGFVVTPQQNRNHFFHQQLVLINQQPLIRRELQQKVIRLRQQQRLQTQQMKDEKALKDDFDEFFNLNSFNDESYSSLDYVFNETSDLDIFHDSSFN